ncbi:MAG: response regulator [Proteobacteria bacterium]|nr:response regulator [Pseudomonadota bacterium]
MNEEVMEQQSILIVDDDDAFRDRVARAFDKRGYDVRVACNGANAIEAAGQDSPELALVDLRMPGEWGLHTVRGLHQIDENTKIVVLTAYGSIATALEAMRLGAVGYLQKPATVDEIELAFRRPDMNPDESAGAPAEVPSLARAQWEHINRVLTECDGNIRKAARLLGLHRRTLQRKLAKFPVSR